MNFIKKSMLFFSASVALLNLASCSAIFESEAVSGDIQVKIPVSNKSSDNSTYNEEVVTLKNIESLKEVRGSYAQFYYSPGLNENRLSGISPLAFFIQTAKNIFVPKDMTSLQMSALYYHIQNLTDFSRSVGLLDQKQTKPFEIALNTKVKNKDVVQANNAFYDGRSDAMIFVPYTTEELPIAVNEGIVAHEFFHSIFYKIVFSDLKKNPQSLTQRWSLDTVHGYEKLWKSQLEETVSGTEVVPISDIAKTPKKTTVELYNETLLRGINEGLADFWGWIYTNDSDFLKWSLSEHSLTRTLKKQTIQTYVSVKSILNVVTEAQQLSSQPEEYLSDFIYRVGTPYARFLKELVEIKTKNNSSASENKIQISEKLKEYLVNLSQLSKSLEKNEIISAESLFLFFGGSEDRGVPLDECELVSKYLNSQDSAQKIYECHKDEATSSYWIQKI